MNRITRCPACATVYRVASQQLQAAGGWLRCGHCQHDFDSTGLVLFWEPLTEPGLANAACETPEPEIIPEPFHAHGESVAPESLSKILDPDPGQTRVSQSDALVSFEDALSTFQQPLSLPSDAASTVLRTADLKVGGQLSVSDKSTSVHSSKLWSVLLFLLALTLVLQVSYVQRHVLVLHWPAAASGLHTFCHAVGCTIEPLQDVEALVIESSTLVRRADDFVLSWTLRNTSGSSVAMTALELTLLAANQQPVLRKVLLPREVQAPQVLQPGQTWAGQLSLRMATETPFSDYRIVSFYP